MNAARVRHVLREIGAIVVLLVVGAAIYYALSALRLIPIALTATGQVVAVLLLGALVVELVARGIREMTSRAFDVRRGGEVAGHPDPERLIETVEAAVRRNPWIVDPYRVQVTLQAITPTSTILAIDALCKSAFEDPPRSSILIDVSRVVASIMGSSA